MEDKFLGCDIELIKPSNGEIKGKKKIVVSTCYFLNDSFSFSDKEKVLGYLISLIDNLEVFQYKINAFCDPANTWIYRVYIDAIVFEIPSIIRQISAEKISAFTKQNHANEKLSKIHENILENGDLLMFISNFMSAYIESMKSNEKYDKIEIYTYRNDKILSHLLSNPEIVVAGHQQTFGTLLRFHPITEDNVDICIMRNCSTSLTPLDLVIQDYWINKTEFPYMEYKSDGYSFVKKGLIFGHEEITYQPSQDIMQKLYPSITVDNLRRSFAGLISCRVIPEKRILFQSKLNHLRNDYVMKNNLQINSKYQYGIDEGIIPLIFEELGTNEANPNIYTVKLTGDNKEYNYRYNPFYKWCIKMNKSLTTQQSTNKKLNRYLPETDIIKTELKDQLPNQYSFLWNIYSASLLSEWCLEYKSHKDDICTKSIGNYLSIENLNDIIFLLKSVDWLKKTLIDFYFEDEEGNKEYSESIKFLSNLTHSQYRPAEDYKEIQSKLQKYLHITSIDVKEEGQIKKLLRVLATQFTQYNFRPFLVIPENITINGVANPSEVEIIKGKLIKYSDSQSPIQAGGAKSKYPRKLSRKTKLTKTKKTIKTKSRK